MLLARPGELMQAESARTLWRTLVTEERERAFVQRTGVDPRLVDELVVIEVGAEGYLLLARGLFDADAIVRAAGDRLAVPDALSEAPIVRREGLTGVGRFAYASLDEHAILVAKDAEPALVAEVLARLADRQRARVLDTPDAQALHATYARAPLLLLAPRPLALAPGTAAAVLMAEARALALGIAPSTRDLQITIAVRGTFPNGIETNLHTWARSVGASDLGRTLGLAAFAENIAIERAKEDIIVRGNVASADLISGVRLLFLDGMREIFPAD